MDNKQINRLIFISVIIVFILFMVLFSLVLSDPITATRAKENAIEYIKEKYSINPEVVSVKQTERICSNYRRATPYVVSMKYEDREFRVFIDNQKYYKDSVADDYGSFYIDEYYNHIIKDTIEINAYHVTPIVKTNSIFSQEKNKIMSCVYAPGVYLDSTFSFEGLQDTQVDLIRKHSEGIIISFIKEENYHFSNIKKLYEKLGYKKIYVLNYKNKKAYNASLDNDYEIYEDFTEEHIKNNSKYLRSAYVYEDNKTYSYIYEN